MVWTNLGYPYDCASFDSANCILACVCLLHGGESGCGWLLQGERM